MLNREIYMPQKIPGIRYNFAKLGVKRIVMCEVLLMKPKYLQALWVEHTRHVCTQSTHREQHSYVFRRSTRGYYKHIGFNIDMRIHNYLLVCGGHL